MNFISSYGNPVCFIQQTSGAQHTGAIDQLDSMKSHLMEILSTLYHFALGQAKEW